MSAFRGGFIYMLGKHILDRVGQLKAIPAMKQVPKVVRNISYRIKWSRFLWTARHNWQLWLSRARRAIFHDPSSPPNEAATPFARAISILDPPKRDFSSKSPDFSKPERLFWQQDFCSLRLRKIPLSPPKYLVPIRAGEGGYDSPSSETWNVLDAPSDHKARPIKKVSCVRIYLGKVVVFEKNVDKPIVSSW